MRAVSSGVSVAVSASLTLASAGCRVLMHTLVDDLVMADNDRQRSIGFSNLLHGVHQPSSARMTTEIAGIRPHAITLCSLSTITFFGTAPTMRSAGLPSLKTSKVGMLWTR
jgi:hypothetical protein